MADSEIRVEAERALCRLLWGLSGRIRKVASDVGRAWGQTEVVLGWVACG